ncbi:UDP-N-acetylmuramoyl-tripeptide--D-alanyl-D-alanine ligase [Lederbergia wuyishanensis]|uniref:UDP-N-acetylmuramoyl-tripeptide--D-alanyl-D-alanine ligase n=1 Tax=Lederbergia wuyishanensis TaxID=1347903 RepID=A0ABU0D9Y6_9BACI|nr:UDP-N-acetylmuramoyl-tripeptide--D-alanyl-D-alanine ligase [Lederbergia wuyishanensis]MCJ8008491.1 UDP-N-acetylmuramoyl-tripeptide--D-alanyl-D-alanine ligase [Lederbergia wuyishanensis]MDQ0345234.1 UDP-N-acetylmuramoyl-tripeptide--D-alanyl-D-alanine ligase [Lederbergia wuyishanensis]
MIKCTLGQLAKMINVENDVMEFQNIEIAGVSFDTRLIEPGNLFVALIGDANDGHKYVDIAFEKGAAAVLWQKDVPNPPKNKPVLQVEDTLRALQDLAHSYRKQNSAKVIAITGSNGKTTTKDIVAAVFSEDYKVHKTDGNFNNHIGLPLTILAMEETTEIAILEMGMSGKGEIALLTRIAEPDAAIITNIGEAHLQDLGSREAIADAKLEIVEGLPKNGLLIYPGNEPLLVKKVSSLKQFNTCTFGETSENDIYAIDITIEENGSNFIVPGLSDEPLFLPISGKHNIMNALAAILAAKEFLISPTSIRAGLKSVKLSNMRMEWHDGIKGTRILNDAYNASPTAMRAVISMVEKLADEREKIVVLGDMLELGEKEVEFHEQIGEELNPDKIKYVFTYGPLAKHIASGARLHFPDERIFEFNDKEKLINVLNEKVEGNELILFKASRGVKLEEVVNAMLVR